MNPKDYADLTNDADADCFMPAVFKPARKCAQCSRLLPRLPIWATTCSPWAGCRCGELLGPGRGWRSGTSLLKDA